MHGLELYVTLVAGEAGLGVSEARALLRLRRAQLAARDGAKGALVKLALRDGRPDLAATAAGSPLLRDLYRLMVLELLDCFPSRARLLRRLLHEDPAPELPATPVTLQHRIARVAAAPIIEAVAEGLLRHRKSRPAPSPDCPVCGSAPYARHGKSLACPLCETRFSGPARTLPRLDAALGAFHAAPLLELVHTLSAETTLQSARA